jgi:glycine cleavage system regulatory protein
MSGCMQLSLVLTVIGKDRPGLVESVARAVAEHGGNWLESRMCRLGGEFAGILRVQVDEERVNAMSAALRALQSEGLNIVAQEDHSGAASAEPKCVALELVGQDRPGIVREISHVLARHGVNVEELSSECSSAPMTGEKLFKAVARLEIPASCKQASLREDLEKIANDLMVDISLEELRRK